MIAIYGPIFGTQGYAIHTKNLASAINKYHPVRLITELPQGWEFNVNDEQLEMLKRKGETDVNIFITQPNVWKLFVEKDKINIGFLIWEGSHIPLSWLEECMNPQIDYIFIASEHTRESIKNTLLRSNLCKDQEEILSKIKLVPHGVDVEKFKPSKKQGKFTFLCNKGYRNEEDRGGTQYAIQAFQEEFKDEDLQLIVKVNPAYPMGQIRETEKIKVIRDNLSTDDMVRLYQNCDVFVSTTRAEAFNIPCLEALACGKPVITTNFGGQTDFCSDKTGWIVDGELKPVEHELMYEETMWLKPNIKLIRESMREAFELPDRSSLEVNARAKSEEYTWDSSAKKVLEVLKLSS